MKRFCIFILKNGIYLQKKRLPRVLIAHGFHKEVTIQDFPLRGNTVYLHVKRRRWIDKTTKEVILNIPAKLDTLFLPKLDSRFLMVSW